MKNCLLVIALIACACSSSNNEETITDNPPFRVTKTYNLDELKNVDSDSIRILRNQIFAQYGYIFKSKDLAEYFDDKEWYTPLLDNVDSLLTDLDRGNIDTLLKAEQLQNEIQFNNFDCVTAKAKPPNPIFVTSIQQALDSLGKPSKTIIDDDLTCPIGQLHFWNLATHNYRLIILGDSYADSINLSAGSRLYAFQLINMDVKADFEFNGVELGESYELVQKELDCIINSNPSFSYSEVQGSSAIDRFIVKDLKNSLVLTNNELWIQFSFNNSDRLSYVLFSSVNVRMAC